MSRFEVSEEFVSNITKNGGWSEFDLEVTPVVEETEEVVEDVVDEAEKAESDKDTIEEDEAPDVADLIVRRQVNEDTDEAIYSLELSEEELTSGVLSEGRALSFVEFFADADSYDLVSANKE